MISGTAMTDSVSQRGRAGSHVVLIAAIGAGLLLAATGALWAQYGTAVFYEMILAGLAACF
jgi:hypothetical protein